MLPAGWYDRTEILDRPDSRPGYARCLEPHDLVVSKLGAGRPKDITFASALIEHGFVAAATLQERADLLDQPNAVIRRVRNLIVRCTPNE